MAIARPGARRRSAAEGAPARMWPMPPLLSIADARARVLAETSPLPAEPVAVAEALGRVLATSVAARGDAPPFPCSAMDGYAVQAGPAGRELRISGESRAGAPAVSSLRAGGAIRISTGAVVPDGAEAVLRQEDAEVGDGAIVTRAPVERGENVRHPGEDMRAGTEVLAAGTRLGPAELGAAVAAGLGELTVARQPRVSVLCTGDELVEAGRPLGPGQIHNSNAPMLSALAREAGAVTVTATRLPDEARATEAQLARALTGSDVVLVAGGVSVGPHDHVKPALASLEVAERFWGVALQPGKPTWFGARDGVLVFGLPGNPVSAYVTFVLFAAPALAALQGRETPAPVRSARLAVPVARSPQREQALRVRLLQDGDGVLAVPNGPQGSHIVSSLLGAGALALIPRGERELAAGERVELVALDG